MQRWDFDIERYLSEIVAWPVPEPEEVVRVFESIEASTRAFRAAMGRVPGTAFLIVERWQERADRDLVTGMLCHRARDDRQTDWSEMLDGVVAEIEQLLPEVESGDERLPLLVAQADILFETLQEIHTELLTLLKAGSRAGRERARRFGVRKAASQRALGEASDALQRRTEAKREFACGNLRLVVARAKRFRNHGVRFEDLIQEGNLGLLRAIDKFEPARGHRFSTYAVWWIDQALIRALQNQSRTIRLPSHIHDRLREFRRVEDRLHVELGDRPSNDELAAALDISEDEVERLSAAGAPIRSIDERLGGDEADGPTLVDFVPAPTGVTPEDGLHNQRVAQAVKRGMRCLRPRERRILALRYGLGGKQPVGLREIGKELGLTGERVRQIANDALERLSERDDLVELYDGDAVLISKTEPLRTEGSLHDSEHAA